MSNYASLCSLSGGGGGGIGHSDDGSDGCIEYREALEFTKIFKVFSEIWNKMEVLGTKWKRRAMKRACLSKKKAVLLSSLKRN